MFIFFLNLVPSGITDGSVVYTKIPFRWQLLRRFYDRWQH
jgi:hypothetical protein